MKGRKRLKRNNFFVEGGGGGGGRNLRGCFFIRKWIWIGCRYPRGGEERKEVYLLTDFSACTLVGILFRERALHNNLIKEPKFSMNE